MNLMNAEKTIEETIGYAEKIYLMTTKKGS